MTRYHFHIRHGDTLIRDEDGDELAAIEDAKAEAILSARELVVQHVRKGLPLDLSGRIEIEEEGKGTLLIVSFDEAIRRDLT